MRYAIIENGVVVNTVIANMSQDSSWIESETAGIGWNLVNGELVAPAPDPLPEPPAAIRHITKLAFKNRMTSTERKAIRAAAKVSPDVEDFVDLADSATYVDLDHTDTRAKVQALEPFGLLGTGRALVILDAPIEDVERFKG